MSSETKLSYGAASDLFQRSFPGGSADQEWKYLGDTTFQFTNLKIKKEGEALSRENKYVIPMAVVKFPNESKGETETEVFDEQGNLVYSIIVKPAEQRQFL